MTEEVKADVQEDPDFSLESLFLKGYVKRKYQITPKFSITFKSLTTEESLAVRNDPEIETGTRAFGISIFGLSSAAAAIIDLNGQSFTGELIEKKNKLKKLAAPVLDKIIEKHSLFYQATNELFPKDAIELIGQIEKK